jgi:hypothetical protein
VRSDSTIMAGRCEVAHDGDHGPQRPPSTTGDTRWVGKTAPSGVAQHSDRVATGSKALPATAAETYTPHATAGVAVQSNRVYLTPYIAVPSVSFRAASDKRCSSGVRVAPCVSSQSCTGGYV